MVAGRGLAQDKPNRIRAYYTLPSGYQLRYLKREEVDVPVRVERRRVTTNGVTTETTTELTVAPGTKVKQLNSSSNKRVGWKNMKFSVKQKGDTVYYTPWPFFSSNESKDAANSKKAEAKLDKQVADKKAKMPANASDEKKSALEKAQQAADLEPIDKKTSKEGVFYEVIGEPTTPNSTLGTYITVPYRALEYGVVGIPFRAYLPRKNRDYLPSVTSGVGLYLGYNFGWTNFYRGGTSKNFSLVPALYLAGATVEVTKDNIKAGTTISDKSTEPALTGGFALLVGREDLTIGAVLGRDFPLTPTGRQWSYASAAYLGAIVSLQISAFK